MDKNDPIGCFVLICLTVVIAATWAFGTWAEAAIWNWAFSS
jgi:hypothetical protein